MATVLTVGDQKSGNISVLNPNRTCNEAGRNPVNRRPENERVRVKVAVRLYRVFEIFLLPCGGQKSVGQVFLTEAQPP